MMRRWNVRLKNVSWGYRDKFSDVLTSLKESGKLDFEGKQDAYLVFDQAFMALVGKNYHTDHVANQFLLALEKRLSWIISVPELMESWVNCGQRLLHVKLYHAIRYFEIWNRTIVVDNPKEMRFVLRTFSIIEKNLDPSCALGFLEGYMKLKSELDQKQIVRFVDEGISMFASNKETAVKFYRLELGSALKLIALISKRAYLKDMRDRMSRLFQSLLDIDFRIDDTTKLDSDELIEKGSTVVCFRDSIYMPKMVSVFDDIELNKQWYMASCYMHSFSVIYKGFPIVHGQKGFESLEDYLSDLKTINLFESIELFSFIDIYRILYNGFKTYKGTKTIIMSVAISEWEEKKRAKMLSFNDKLLKLFLLDEESENVIVNRFRELVNSYIEKIDSFNDIKKYLPNLYDAYLEVKGNRLEYSNEPYFSFYSDYRYFAQMANPPSNKASLDQNQNDKEDENSKSSNNDKDENQTILSGISNSEDKNRKEEEKNEDDIIGYVYDEWSNASKDYLSNWCTLHEVSFESNIERKVTLNMLEANKALVHKVKQTFEKMKPDLLTSSKHLLEGDEIIVDDMVSYIIQKKANLSPEERIYRRDYKDKRDIATALLIDISGSTNENVGGMEVIEIEKRAASLLSQGLLELGDQFGIFGFSGVGRNNCQFYTFKGFDEDWENENKWRLVDCRPSGSTRMGVAIRHALTKISEVESKQKLIIIITDGKPQDSDGYTSTDLYAQYDVRMSCLEAKKAGVNVFCVSTENNSLDELALMFPPNHYVVMPSMEKLPILLAKSYLKLTT